MNPETLATNGVAAQLVQVRPEPPGQFTAQLVGLPELRATASSREEAIQQVRMLLSQWLASGQLVTVTVPPENPWLRIAGHIDPNDPAEQEFQEILAQHRREDLERTLREYDEEDQRCSSSSSTPTT